jgi:hypothetical protein
VLRRPDLPGTVPGIRALDCEPGSDVYIAGTYHIEGRWFRSAVVRLKRRWFLQELPLCDLYDPLAWRVLVSGWLDSFGTLTRNVGTDCCDVWEVDDTPEVLVYGHSGAVAAVAWHPSQPHVLVSVDSVGQVRSHPAL